DIDEFRIAEDGRTEKISRLVQAGESPLQLVLLFDLSGSIHSDFEFERTAASRFVEKVWNPGDLISLISVSSRPSVQLTAASSPEEVLKVLSELEPAETATAFFDAVVAAAELQNRATAPNTRQAAVIFSDGEDNRSDCVFSDALSSVRHSNMVVYAINPSGASIRLNEISRMGQKWLSALAGKTGGNAFVSKKVSDLEGIYDRIAFELRAQYLLSYYSSNSHTDGSFRSISVSLPGRPDLRVRARQGYYALEIASDMRD
ncbi:MAG: VWA domain-containing protein, partial [Acidobacteriota bacterium]